MKIGIIALSLNRSAAPGFYNSQELGMGKALAAKGHTVTVYKLYDRAQPAAPLQKQACGRLTYTQLPARSLGINGFFDLKLLDSGLDVLICFCDTQLYTKKVAVWCRRHRIAFYPYIGVITSSSTNALKKRLMNFATGRLIRFYQKQPEVWGKTPSICAQMNDLGIRRTKLVPIGLDEELLHKDYAKADPSALKQKHGFAPRDQVLLFIGRLVPEKEPLEMIALFAGLRGEHPYLHLCMIGKGPLEAAVKDAVSSAGLTSSVTLLPSVPNQEMWEFYRLSSCYVNLNRHEIYGMAILEAMYYECPVIARRAPGPDYILDGGRFGRLCRSSQEIAESIRTVLPHSLPKDNADGALDFSYPHETITNARRRVLSEYLWERCLPELPLRADSVTS